MKGKIQKRDKYMKKIIVGISGADGISLAACLLKELKKIDTVKTYLIYTKEAEKLANNECGGIKEIQNLADNCYDNSDMSAEIIREDFLADGMVVVPCSAKVVEEIAEGRNENLLLQAACKIQKKKLPLVLAEVEASQSAIHWKNMSSLIRHQNVVIMPWVLTYYKDSEVVEYMDRHMVGKICRYFDVSLKSFDRV